MAPENKTAGKPARIYCSVTNCRRWANLENGICPHHVILQSKDKGEVTYKCLECDHPCKNTERALLCERCNCWVHSACRGVSDEVYDTFYKESTNLACFRFYCAKCDSKVDEALEKYSFLEKETKILKTEMSEVKASIDGIKKTIKTSIKDNISTIMVDKAEIDKRKMNLIVFGLPEPIQDETDKSEWSNDKKVAKDIATMSKIITDDINVGLSPRNGLIDARRLGLKTAGKSRPLKIEFRDLQTKRDVLTRAKKLRDSTDPVARKLYINPDLTEKQREEDKILRKEMWRLREEENKNAVIKRGKIVISDFDVRKSRTPAD